MTHLEIYWPGYVMAFAVLAFALAAWRSQRHDKIGLVPPGPSAPGEIRWIGELSRVKAEPGDVFVFRVDQILNAAQVAQLSAQIRNVLGNVRVLVLDRVTNLEVRQVTAAEEQERCVQLAASMDCAHHCGVEAEVAAALRDPNSALHRSFAANTGRRFR